MLKKKIKGYMIFDAYDIADITGQYFATYRVFKKGKYIGIAIFE
jgi:hypothetical protein